MVLNAVGGVSAKAKLMTFSVANSVDISSDTLRDNRYSIQNVDVPTETIKGFFIRSNTKRQSNNEIDCMWTLADATHGYGSEWFACANAAGTAGETYGNNTEQTRVWKYDHDTKTLTIQIWNMAFDFSSTTLGAGDYTLVVWW